MPIKKVPKTLNSLPSGAKRIWVSAFNSAYNSCKGGGGSTKVCDQRAARIAWGAVKRAYRKRNGKWVKRKKSTAAYTELSKILPAEDMLLIFHLLVLEEAQEVKINTAN